MRGSQMAVFRRDQPQFRTSGTVQLGKSYSRAPLWRMRPRRAKRLIIRSLGLRRLLRPAFDRFHIHGPSNATKRTHGPSDEQTAQWAIPAGP